MDVLYFGNIQKFLFFLVEKYGEDEVEKLRKGEFNKCRINMIYTPGINEWKGNKTLQAIMNEYF